MPSETRPVIGINLDYIAGTKTNRPYLRLHPGYVDFRSKPAQQILSAGGDPQEQRRQKAQGTHTCCRHSSDVCHVIRSPAGHRSV